MAGDLHIHSSYSDGSFKPEELVNMAAKKGIGVIAIADHDTVEAIEPARRAGKQAGIEIIPALEFSTFLGKAEIHILGYYIDYQNKELNHIINKIFKVRLTRAKKMIELLNDEGVDITYSQVKEIAGDEYIGRPHIARAMIKAGYIDERGQAFTSDYIGNDGEAYVSKYKLTPQDAINIIEEAGGIPVLAHPSFINHGNAMTQEDIAGFVESGLKGIEVFHSKHDKKTVRYYKKIAQEMGLLITGGSDFHGENSPDVKLGDILLSDPHIEQLKDLN
jgi:predicted metal-dependent phosphoesterase TrpH